MAKRGAHSIGANGGRGVRFVSNDLLQLVLNYAKQETLGPIKGLGRFVVFGITGSVALSIGVGVLLVALLRALQTETGSTFGGKLTWLPYVITAGAAVLVAGLAGWRVTKGAARKTSSRRRTGAGRG